MAEGGGTVFLDRIVSDPREAVSEDDGREKKGRPPLDHGGSDAQDGRARSGKVEGAIPPFGVLAHIERPKLLDRRESSGSSHHTDILALPSSGRGKG